MWPMRVTVPARGSHKESGVGPGVLCGAEVVTAIPVAVARGGSVSQYPAGIGQGPASLTPPVVINETASPGGAVAELVAT
jgi:hypothetical protein